MYKQISVIQLMQVEVTDGHQDAHFQAPFVPHELQLIQALSAQRKMWPLNNHTITDLLVF